MASGLDDHSVALASTTVSGSTLQQPWLVGPSGDDTGATDPHRVVSQSSTNPVKAQCAA